MDEFKNYYQKDDYLDFCDTCVHRGKDKDMHPCSACIMTLNEETP